MFLTKRVGRTEGVGKCVCVLCVYVRVKCMQETIDVTIIGI